MNSSHPKAGGGGGTPPHSTHTKVPSDRGTNLALVMRPIASRGGGDALTNTEMGGLSQTPPPRLRTSSTAEKKEKDKFRWSFGTSGGNNGGSSSPTTTLGAMRAVSSSALFRPSTTSSSSGEQQPSKLLLSPIAQARQLALLNSSSGGGSDSTTPAPDPDEIKGFTTDANALKSSGAKSAMAPAHLKERLRLQALYPLSNATSPGKIAYRHGKRAQLMIADAKDSLVGGGGGGGRGGHDAVSGELSTAQMAPALQGATELSAVTTVTRVETTMLGAEHDYFGNIARREEREKVSVGLRGSPSSRQRVGGGGGGGAQSNSASGVMDFSTDDGPDFTAQRAGNNSFLDKRGATPNSSLMGSRPLNSRAGTSHSTTTTTQGFLSSKGLVALRKEEQQQQGLLLVEPPTSIVDFPLYSDTRAFLAAELRYLNSNDKAGRLTVYREAFTRIIDGFRAFGPLLDEIRAAYEERLAELEELSKIALHGDPSMAIEKEKFLRLQDEALDSMEKGRVQKNMLRKRIVDAEQAQRDAVSNVSNELKELRETRVELNEKAILSTAAVRDLEEMLITFTVTNKELNERIDALNREHREQLEDSGRLVKALQEEVAKETADHFETKKKLLEEIATLKREAKHMEEVHIDPKRYEAMVDRCTKLEEVVQALQRKTQWLEKDLKKKELYEPPIDWARTSPAAVALHERFPHKSAEDIIRLLSTRMDSALAAERELSCRWGHLLALSAMNTMGHPLPQLVSVSQSLAPAVPRIRGVGEAIAALNKAAYNPTNAPKTTLLIENNKPNISSSSSSFLPTNTMAKEKEVAANHQPPRFLSAESIAQLHSPLVTVLINPIEAAEEENAAMANGGGDGNAATFIRGAAIVGGVTIPMGDNNSTIAPSSIPSPSYLLKLLAQRSDLPSSWYYRPNMLLLLSSADDEGQSPQQPFSNNFANYNSLGSGGSGLSSPLKGGVSGGGVGAQSNKKKRGEVITPSMLRAYRHKLVKATRQCNPVANITPNIVRQLVAGAFIALTSNANNSNNNNSGNVFKAEGDSRREPSFLECCDYVFSRFYERRSFAFVGDGSLYPFYPSAEGRAIPKLRNKSTTVAGSNNSLSPDAGPSAGPTPTAAMLNTNNKVSDDLDEEDEDDSVDEEERMRQLAIAKAAQERAARAEALRSAIAAMKSGGPPPALPAALQPSPAATAKGGGNTTLGAVIAGETHRPHHVSAVAVGGLRGTGAAQQRNTKTSSIVQPLLMSIAAAEIPTFANVVATILHVWAQISVSDPFYRTLLQVLVSGGPNFEKDDEEEEMKAAAASLLFNAEENKKKNAANSSNNKSSSKEKTSSPTSKNPATNMMAAAASSSSPLNFFGVPTLTEATLKGYSKHFVNILRATVGRLLRLQHDRSVESSVALGAAGGKGGLSGKRGGGGGGGANNSLIDKDGRGGGGGFGAAISPAPFVFFATPTADAAVSPQPPPPSSGGNATAAVGGGSSSGSNATAATMSIPAGLTVTDILHTLSFDTLSKTPEQWAALRIALADQLSEQYQSMCALYVSVLSAAGFDAATSASAAINPSLPQSILSGAPFFQQQDNTTSVPFSPTTTAINNNNGRNPPLRGAGSAFSPSASPLRAARAASYNSSSTAAADADTASSTRFKTTIAAIPAPESFAAHRHHIQPADIMGYPTIGECSPFLLTLLGQFWGDVSVLTQCVSTILHEYTRRGGVTEGRDVGGAGRLVPAITHSNNDKDNKDSSNGNVNGSSGAATATTTAAKITMVPAVVNARVGEGVTALQAIALLKHSHLLLAPLTSLSSSSSSAFSPQNMSALLTAMDAGDAILRAENQILYQKLFDTAEEEVAAVKAALSDAEAQKKRLLEAKEKEGEEAGGEKEGVDAANNKVVSGGSKGEGAIAEAKPQKTQEAETTPLAPLMSGANKSPANSTTTTTSNLQGGGKDGGEVGEGDETLPSRFLQIVLKRFAEVAYTQAESPPIANSPRNASPRGGGAGSGEGGSSPPSSPRQQQQPTTNNTSGASPQLPPAPLLTIVAPPAEASSWVISHDMALQMIIAASRRSSVLRELLGMGFGDGEEDSVDSDSSKAPHRRPAAPCTPLMLPKLPCFECDPTPSYVLGTTAEGSYAAWRQQHSNGNGKGGGGGMGRSRAARGGGGGLPALTADGATAAASDGAAPSSSALVDPTLNALDFSPAFNRCNTLYARHGGIANGVDELLHIALPVPAGFNFVSHSSNMSGGDALLTGPNSNANAVVMAVNAPASRVGTAVGGTKPTTTAAGNNPPPTSPTTMMNTSSAATAAANASSLVLRSFALSSLACQDVYCDTAVAANPSESMLLIPPPPPIALPMMTNSTADGLVSAEGEGGGRSNAPPLRSNITAVPPSSTAATGGFSVSGGRGGNGLSNSPFTSASPSSSSFSSSSLSTFASGQSAAPSLYHLLHRSVLTAMAFLWCPPPLPSGSSHGSKIMSANFTSSNGGGGETMDNSSGGGGGGINNSAVAVNVSMTSKGGASGGAAAQGAGPSPYQHAMLLTAPSLPAAEGRKLFCARYASFVAARDYRQALCDYGIFSPYSNAVAGGSSPLSAAISYRECPPHRILQYYQNGGGEKGRVSSAATSSSSSTPSSVILDFYKTLFASSPSVGAESEGSNDGGGASAAAAAAVGKIIPPHLLARALTRHVPMVPQYYSLALEEDALRRTVLASQQPQEQRPPSSSSPPPLLRPRRSTLGTSMNANNNPNAADTSLGASGGLPSVVKDLRDRERAHEIIAKTALLFSPSNGASSAFQQQQQVPTKPLILYASCSNQ